jgi:UPF0176 protein
MTQSVIVAFYKFVNLPDYKSLQSSFYKECKRNKILGTILLAEEGVNSTIAGPREGIDAFLSFIRQDPRFSDMPHKESFADLPPFYRLKVRLKKEIVTLGVKGVDPVKQPGQYMKPEEWNDLIADPEVILIDTRNDYEVEIGTFKGAVNPNTQSFREFPSFVKENFDPTIHKKIAMFCTGGIRCEKAASYMINQGFKEVYQLEGGILKYLEKIPEEESLWEGECFVFDNRVAVANALKRGSYDQCFGCRYPLSKEDKDSPLYEPGVSCPRCYSKKTTKKEQGLRQRQRQIEIAKERNQNHLGPRHR